MKNTSSFGLQALARHLSRTVRPLLTAHVAGLVAAGVMLPASAYAADSAATTAPAQAAPKSVASKTHKQAAKAHEKVAAKKIDHHVVKAAAVGEHKRVYVHLAADAHGGRMRRIAFAPSRVQPFRLDSDGGVALRSSAAYVVDQTTQEPLYDKNSRAIMPIASISKLMTAMVVLDSKAPLDQPIDVTDADRDMVKHTGSRLSVGSVLSREDMLHIALMASENRAAAALSRYYPGGRPGFVAAMNKKALELGMTDTHFIDPTGLSPNTSSARDLAKMVAAAYQYPLIREFSTDSSYDVFTGRKHIHYMSTNALVRNHSWQIGLQKTGFTNEAGECMVMQTTVNDKPVIMVLLDSVGRYSRVADAQRLHAWLDNGGVQRMTSADSGVHTGT
jgi:D-alanyl-D-alanine endopeptidase (penicillin-binding protein 7)